MRALPRWKPAQLSLFCSALGMMLCVGSIGAGDRTTASANPAQDFAGRWNLEVDETGGFTTAWLEVVPLDTHRASGRLVWLYGGAEPIAEIQIVGRELRFLHHFMRENLVFTATLAAGRLTGFTSGPRTSVHWTATRSPDLPRSASPQWDAFRPLFNGQDLSGWSARNPRGLYCWQVDEGVLVNDSPCWDLITYERFADFRLHLEFKVIEGTGSGVYLRGRYEVQIADDAERPASPRTTGAIFGYIAPSTSVAKPRGEWQSMDVELVGRVVTVSINDVVVVSDFEIPGITGAALDIQEDRPGPIMLQGDHGRVAFRNVLVAPSL